ncbi:hypothetical protein A2619_01250 [candidate division WWE3 bacterium RIFOXYD1_FULL_39_9]|uniref:LytR/CpsA/Psr regulator C-terminal domain-containing protein n=1 Tax=candidate division WWE3 bacterium RIFOXYD1_FULL_39_9 TaxID=1802649 RepID=A0A1F4X3G1_UNCKA|nr:MAG: hypothetical protein A2619_01250 [candidate division WWE3 bacterium RIFOXYD1_FULL_39_9]
MPRKTAQKPKIKLRRTRRASGKVRNNPQKNKILQISIIFLISLTALVAYGGYKLIDRSYASAMSSSSEGYSIKDLDVVTVTYIVVNDLDADPVVIEKLKYVVIDKENKRVSIFQIPIDMQVDVPGKFGVEEISKLFSLAALESDDTLESGAAYVQKVVFNIFAFKTDKYVVSDSSFDPALESVLLSGNLLGLAGVDLLANFSTSVYTNLSFGDLLDTIGFMNSVSSDRVEIKELSYEYQLGSQALDSQFQEMTSGSTIGGEEESIAVLNGSSTPGLASFTSRVIKNIGGRVVAINNSDTSYEKSIIVAKNPNSEAVQQISRVFGITNIKSKEEGGIEVGEGELYRADIVVILGFDSREIL